MERLQPKVTREPEFIEQIGSGGFAQVDLVKDDNGQKWARKQIRKDLIKKDPDILERFGREVRLHKNLEHPNIIDVRYADPQEGYLLTEYVDGGTLQTLLDNEFPDGIDYPTLVKILVPIGEALTYIHDHAKLVHLDITPGNILIQEIRTSTGGREWKPLLIDFGLARVIDLNGQAKGGKSLYGGTPSYRAPEQSDLTKGFPGKHSDIYSLGLVIAVMLTGLRAREVFDILQGTNNVIPPTLSPEVMRVLKKATHGNIENRYPTVKGLIKVFKQAIEDAEYWTQEQLRNFDPEEETRTAPSNRMNTRQNVSIRPSSTKKTGFMGAILLQKIVAIGATVLLLSLLVGLLIWNLPETHLAQLGGLDLNSYCKSLHYDGVTADYSSCSSTIRMSAVCDTQYPGGNLTPVVNSSTHIWSCHDTKGNDLGGISRMPEYCKTQSYYGMPVAVNSSDGNWTCQQKLDMTIVCMAQYNRRDVQARKDDSSGLWQCYGFL